MGRFVWGPGCQIVQKFMGWWSRDDWWMMFKPTTLLMLSAYIPLVTGSSPPCRQLNTFWESCHWCNLSKPEPHQSEGTKRATLEFNASMCAWRTSAMPPPQSPWIFLDVPCMSCRYICNYCSILCLSRTLHSAVLVYFSNAVALFLLLFQQKAHKILVGGVSLRHHLDFAISWTLHPSLAHFGSSWVSSEVRTLLENVRNWLQTGSSKKISVFFYWNTHSL